MTQKRKAAFPSKAGRPEKTASNATAGKITTPRQKIKQKINCAACMGNIPVAWAIWLLEEWGITHA